MSPMQRVREFFEIDGVRYDGRIILAEWIAYQEAAARRLEELDAAARSAVVRPTRDHAEKLKAAERARIELEGDGCCTALDPLASYLDGYDNALDDFVAQARVLPEEG